MDIVGIGALNVDLLYQVRGLDIAGRRFEAGGETFGSEDELAEVIEALDREGKLLGQSGGGSAANTVYALARMGFSAGFLGVVGKDEYGRFLIRSLDGVDTGRIKRYRRSGMCISLLSGNDRSLLVLPNANDFFSFTEEDIDYVNGANFVHLSSFVSDGALAMQERLLGHLGEEVLVSFAPGELYARRGIERLRPIIERSRIVFLNDRELGLLTGRELKDGMRTILGMGPNVVACALEERGSLIVTKNSEIAVPAKKTVVVDRTGAGDVYAAGFLAGYMGGATLERCGEMGSAAAALSIASYGRSGYPDRRFLRRFLEEE